MNDFVLIDNRVAILIIVLLILFGIGFCVQAFLLQLAADKNKWLRERNEQLRDRLSDKELELYIVRNGIVQEE